MDDNDPINEIPEGQRYRAAADAAPMDVNVVNSILPVHFERENGGGHGPRAIPNTLWQAIRDRTAGTMTSPPAGIAFRNYEAFIATSLCSGVPGKLPPVGCTGEGEFRTNSLSIRTDEIKERMKHLPRPLQGVEAYQILKSATELFLLRNCGVYATDTSQQQNYPIPDLHPFFKEMSAELKNETNCYKLLQAGLDCPCMMELIWSYWHEEGMLVQTISAIARRFQNRRSSEKDPLGAMEIGYLRPLANLLWGYIQDEVNRLSVPRRSDEYQHLYGIGLLGKAVPQVAVADCRSRFLSAFHTILNRAADFYRQALNALIVPDPFPILEAVKEANWILSEGMHNQFRDLTWTARVEMLVQMWLLSRPELKAFLPTREALTYEEGWMRIVDAMNQLQGRPLASARYFHDLAVTGEAILLSIRFGDWNAASEEDARAWVIFWQPEIRKYTQSYRAVTGIDLALPLQPAMQIDTTPPAIHLQKCLRAQVQG